MNKSFKQFSKKYQNEYIFTLFKSMTQEEIIYNWKQMLGTTLALLEEKNIVITIKHLDTHKIPTDS
jgi:hypothetical protein